MPITYEHRVPAATLGGLALAAGQEQYAAKRGQEERERAMKLAQMAQQQQMQNQRLAYGAASTQYRTAADYNKFIMGAQIDAQGRQRDQNNRLALMDHGDELAAGREQERWDRAGEQAGQQDTFGAWKEYVTSTLPSLNQDGRDILNTHAGKVRSIMANQNFNRTQKSSAVSMVLEEVQGLGLDQNYALEQMYEAGKTYHNETGEVFLWDGTKGHIQGRHYDGLIKPDIMPEAEWMRTGRNEAWMDKHTVYESRDEDYKLVRHFISDGKMISIADADDLYKAQEQKKEDDALREKDQVAHGAWSTARSAYIDKFLDRMDTDLGKISTMDGNDENGLLSPWERHQERLKRMDEATKHADLLYPEPSWRAPPGDFDARGGQFSPGGAMGGEIDLPTGPDPGPMGMGGQPSPEPEPIERPPLGDAGAGPIGGAADQAQQFRKMTENISDPRVKDMANRAGEIMARGGPRNEEEVQFLRQAENAIEVSNKHAQRALDEGVSLGVGGTASFGQAHTDRVRRAQALRQGAAEGGTGDIERAKEMAGGPGELWNVPSGIFDQFVKPMVSPEEGTKSGSPMGYSPPGLGGVPFAHITKAGGMPEEDWGLSAPGGNFPGQLEDKPRRKWTEKQVRAREAIQALGDRKDRVEAQPTEWKGVVPYKGFYRPKGEGLVGTLAAGKPPSGVSAEAEQQRIARGEDPYSEKELKDIAKREYSKPGREVSKEEKLQDKIEDPKTVEKTLFTELWPKTERVEHGGEMLILRLPKTKVDRIYDALDEWDLHTPRMTKEKFQKGIHDDEGLRSEYLIRLKTKLTIKEARSDQESAKAKSDALQAQFEKRYRAERKK